METVPELLPMDAHNAALLANVHPPDWTNPVPADRYNLVVIGAGTAGLVSAAGAAGLGARVALVERHLMGGDCLNVGCVPSKAIIRSSRALAELRDAARLGVRAPEGRADFGAVMARMREIRARLSHLDSARRFTELGVDVFLGSAAFTGPHTAEVDGRTLRFRKAVIATGARPVQPDIPGLAEAGFLTNETVFSLTERPDRLAVLGGGPIGCELAQAFRRFGCEVTIIQDLPQFLPKEDPDAAAILAETFRREGIQVKLGRTVREVATRGGEKVLHLKEAGQAGGGARPAAAPGVGGAPETIAVDAILLGVGRAPNVEGFGLERANVRYRAQGVEVNDRLQTSNPDIYAAGDVCLAHKFTHTADHAARIVIQNALFLGRKKFSAAAIPWCTFTEPEIAHAGMYESDAAARGIAIDTYVRQMSEVDRAVTDSEEEGFVKVHVRKGTDRVLGATIVAPHAGELIGELTLAIEAGIGLSKIATVIHPYPTQSIAIRQLGDLYNRTRLTPFVARLFRGWLALAR